MSTTHGRISAQAVKRLQAGELILRGFDNEEIMDITECSLSSIKRWRTKVERDGLQALARQTGSGRSPGLAPEQLQELKTVILAGAKAAGYVTDRWTTRIVADLIRKKWNIPYSRKHVSRILASLGFSFQKPEVKSTKYSQAAVDDWKKRVWPRIKKKRTNAV